MAGQPIRVQDSITVDTSFGSHVVELCYGDITQLPVEEKMDIIMVSAFIGDYSNVRGTLIGALNHRLDLSTAELARDKEMDLRTHYSCWISKPLPPGLPFGRLLCFEKTRGGDHDSLKKQIRDIFKVLVPILKNQSTTIITPLLATGHQRSDETIVLQATVNGAISWIQAGLPLKTLKIVLYQDDSKELNACFSKLKTKQMKSQNKKKNATLDYDVFLLYQPTDSNVVSRLTEKLHNKRADLNIYSSISKFDKQSVWQEGIFDLMMGSKRVVPLLTPNFVNSDECLEMFNMAICCTRLRGQDFLVPLYFETIQIMPVSVSLVQFLDCRVRKEGDTPELKMELASARLILEKEEKERNDVIKTEIKDNFSHDVFISYAHKNPKEANILLDEFEKQFPDIDVFFDRQDLQVGGMWQKSLYFSLDAVRCVVALVSSAYLQSVVCQEEFNIAMYRSQKQPRDFILILVCIEDIPSVPYVCGQHQLVDCRGNQFSKLVPSLAQSVAAWVTEKKRPECYLNISKSVPMFNFERESEMREKDVYDNYSVKLNSIQRKEPYKMPPLDQAENHVVVSVSQNDLSLATCLLYQLQKTSPDMRTTLMVDNTGMDMKCLQSAKQIVVFLSRQYLESAHHLEELFISIIRQRNDRNRKILYLCQASELGETPSFAHLLPIDVSLEDAFWKKMFEEARKTVTLDLPELKGSFTYSSQNYSAMTKLADDILRACAGLTDVKPSPVIAEAGKERSGDVMEISKCLVDTKTFFQNKNTQMSSAEKKPQTTENVAKTHSVPPSNLPPQANPIDSSASDPMSSEPRNPVPGITSKSVSSPSANQTLSEPSIPQPVALSESPISSADDQESATASEALKEKKSSTCNIL
ncbi:uncharacterized protein LOC111131714 [Crassostrea virginica]